MICETLQSELNNFTQQFFGPIVKTDGAPGVVNWELPCNLDIGITDNPRGFDEGVSCYFLRLFNDRILELKGPNGEPGLPGTAGSNAYTVTLESFSQPVSSAPFTLRTLFNPAIEVEEVVYIHRSGWYQVHVAAPTGNLTLSLIQPMLGATGTIPPGKLVIPTGPKGQDQTGLPGDTGRPGDKGGPGDKGLKGIPGDPAMALPHGATQVNGTFIGEGRSDLTTFVVRASIPTAEVVYFAVPPAPDAPALTPAQQAAEDLKKVRVKLTSAGKYLFRITSSFATTGDSAIIYTGLYDVTNPTNNTSPRSGDNRFLPGSFTNSQSQVSGVNSPLTLSCIVETTSNYTTIEWRAFGQRCQIDPLFTTMSWVRIT